MQRQEVSAICSSGDLDISLDQKMSIKTGRVLNEYTKEDFRKCTAFRYVERRSQYPVSLDKSGDCLLSTSTCRSVIISKERNRIAVSSTNGDSQFQALAFALTAGPTMPTRLYGQQLEPNLPCPSPSWTSAKFSPPTCPSRPRKPLTMYVWTITPAGALDEVHTRTWSKSTESSLSL